MPALRLEGIEKVFPNGSLAVAGVDLEVSEEEIVVLLGPSGCGKSTLLRIIAGVETPTRGRVTIDGADVTDLPPQKRDVAMVFQHYALYPHMTVRENLAFGLRMRKVPADAAARRVGEVAEVLGLTPFLDRKPSQLSGGQRQRVALGRATARRAKVFLLDEPLSNLDAQLRSSTRIELARLHRDLKVPMLYVTHDQEEAMTLGGRIVVMQAGRFRQIGPPMEIYSRPATRFVGGFVGSPRMNLFPGRLIDPPDGTARIETLGAVLLMEAPRSSAVRSQMEVARETEPPGRPTTAKEVVVGIRPEDIDIVNPTEADLVARADVIEPLGREVLFHFVLDEGKAGEAPVEIRVMAPPRGAVSPGSMLGLRFRRERIHLFDPATDERFGG